MNATAAALRGAAVGRVSTGTLTQVGFLARRSITIARSARSRILPPGYILPAVSGLGRSIPIGGVAASGSVLVGMPSGAVGASGSGSAFASCSNGRRPSTVCTMCCCQPGTVCTRTSSNPAARIRWLSCRTPSNRSTLRHR